MRTPILTDACCMVCSFSMREKQGRAAQTFCHRNPPAVTVLMAPGPQGATPVKIASFPPVQAEMWCGEFKRRIIHGHASATALQPMDA